jgi:predicted nucleic acid-binding Zn ribbon protein
MAEPSRVGDLLHRVPGLTRHLREAELVRAWAAIAGPAAARSRADAIEDGVLRVAVDSSGWLHRLTLEEPRLLLRCREAAPDVALRAIRFHLAPSPDSPQGAVSGALPEGQREVSS